MPIKGGAGTKARVATKGSAVAKGGAEKPSTGVATGAVMAIKG